MGPALACCAPVPSPLLLEDAAARLRLLSVTVRYCPSLSVTVRYCYRYIKKTPLQAFSKISARGLIAVSLGEGDSLVRASLCTIDDSVILCSSLGFATRFSTNQAR